MCRRHVFLYISRWNGGELLKVLQCYIEANNVILRLLGRYQNKTGMKTKPCASYVCVQAANTQLVWLI